MKTSHTNPRTASSNLLGTLLLISLLSTVLMSFNLETLTNLYNACISQWQNFADGLSMFQPHRAF